MIFNVVDKHKHNAPIVQQIEADYIREDELYHRTKFYKVMPWYRRDRLVGTVTGMEFAIGAAVQTPDVVELERMIRL
ncbi:MAG: hypothetical protein JWO13_799 [Acidobacteriales bacterium]|nr:hypothetical protein [Terriglobales bacterium]